jgi:hypothetical protein
VTLSEAVETIAHTSGLGCDTLVRLFSGAVLPALVCALKELGADNDWVALNLHQGGASAMCGCGRQWAEGDNSEGFDHLTMICPSVAG